MRYFYIFIFILIVFGCGRESAKNENSTDSKVSPKESSKKAIEDNSPQSISLESKADLPECAAKNQTQLAYILENKTFYVCKKEWVAIDIGPQYEEPLAYNEWKDPITQKIWLIGNTANYAAAKLTCSGDYRLPSSDEGMIAALHGIRIIAQQMNAPANFWTNIEDDGFSAQMIYLNGHNPTIGHSVMTLDTISVFCIKD